MPRKRPFPHCHSLWSCNTQQERRRSPWTDWEPTSCRPTTLRLPLGHVALGGQRVRKGLFLTQTETRPRGICPTTDCSLPFHLCEQGDKQWPDVPGPSTTACPAVMAQLPPGTSPPGGTGPRFWLQVRWPDHFNSCVYLSVKQNFIHTWHYRITCSPENSICTGSRQHKVSGQASPWMLEMCDFIPECGLNSLVLMCKINF